MGLYRFTEAAPSFSEYRGLRRAVGWDDLPADAIRKGLGSALYSLSVYGELGSIVGCGRVLGDGGMHFYIQDVMVMPEHQGLGIGKEIVRPLLGYLEANAQPGSVVGVFAPPNAEGFAEKCGLQHRGMQRSGVFVIWGA